MSIPVGSNLDFNQNQLLNAVLQVLGTDPASPATGQIWVNNAVAGAAVVKYYDGTIKQTLGTSNAAGTVTSVSVAAANGFAGTVASPSTTPVITLTTSVTGLVKGNGTALSAAAAGTDYLTPAGDGSGLTNLNGSNVATGTVAAARLPSLDAITAPAADVNLNSHKATNLSAPTAATDAATKGYVDSLVQGLNPKTGAIAASTANVSLSSAPSTLDGVTLSPNDRVLLKDQTTLSQNGLYVFSTAGAALTRAADMDAWVEVPGAYLWVEEGTANADTAWVCTSDPGGTLGTTAITFVRFTGAAELGATTPVTISANSITLNYTARLANNAGSLDLASGVATAGTYTSVTVDTYGRVTAGGELLSANGIATRTASGTYTARTVTGTANQIAVTSGDGVAGNPTLAFAAGARANLGATGVYNAAGSGTGTTITVTQATHGLGTSANFFTDIDVVVWDVSGSSAVKIIVDTAVNKTTGDVTVTFAQSQTLPNFRVTIIGK